MNIKNKLIQNQIKFDKSYKISCRIEYFFIFILNYLQYH